VGDFSSVVGFRNIANGVGSSALGSTNTANGQGSSAIGASNTATGLNSNAVGFTNTALGDDDAAIGTGNSTGVTDFFSLSGNNAALGVGNTATGGFAAFIESPSYSSAAVGAGNQATGGNSSALGVDNLASAINSTAIGYSSVASADDSTAIGSNSVADRANTLSVGAAGDERQIVNVADATQDTDAANLSQLYPLATALGGGASYAGGVFTAPTYLIQNNNYTDVGAAFAAVDGALDDINERIVAVGGIQGEQGESAYEVAVSNGFAGSESDWLESLQGDQGPSGPTGPEGPAGGGPRSLVYDGDERDVLTLAGAEGTRIANVADGVEANDAVNLQQMQAGDAATLDSAQDYADAGDADTLASANEYTDNTATETLTADNAYTDSRMTSWDDRFDSMRQEVDQRFGEQGKRINTVGALSAALALAAPDARVAGANQFSMGMGHYRDQQAISVGYSRLVSPRVAVRMAAAFADGENAAGVGLNVGW
jgi:autotransporter adhesin